MVDDLGILMVNSTTKEVNLLEFHIKKVLDQYSGEYSI